MLKLIENGEIYAPEPLGKGSVLISHDTILRIGEIDKSALLALDPECEVIEAADCFVTPGFIDPHEHLLGGSGESGFATQTPEIHASEIVSAGITTAVGCLGVDTTMKTMPGLLAKAKALKEEGLNAYLWSGGYNVPPTSITKNVRDDILFVEEIIGGGEIAISDERSTEPDFHELAHLVHDVYVGGMLSRKSGLTHFHIGNGPRKLQLLRDLIEKDDVRPEWLYPTHITRSEALMMEAVDLSKRGSFVDIDTVDEDLPKWLKFYRENGGETKKLTVSSDCSITGPQNLFEQIRECLLNDEFPFEEVLALVTKNTADALKLRNKGTLKAGKAADILMLDKENLNLRDVFSNGRHLFKDGRTVFKEAFLTDSNRKINLIGDKEVKN
jgi:beta-aspartyl-dipeptidase (metallo-type)